MAQMTYFHDAPVVVFQHVPHTSGRFISGNLLRRVRGPPEMPVRDQRYHEMVDLIHVPWEHMVAKRGGRVPDRVFAVVRNPYARLLAVYDHLASMPEAWGRLTTFAAFVRDMWTTSRDRIVSGDMTFAENIFPPMWDIFLHVFTTPQWVFTGTKTDAKCTIFKMEGLDYQRLFAFAGIPGMPPPPERRRTARWEQYYTPELKAMVAELYAADFALFGYTI